MILMQMMMMLSWTRVFAKKERVFCLGVGPLQRDWTYSEITRAKEKKESESERASELENASKQQPHERVKNIYVVT